MLSARLVFFFCLGALISELNDREFPGSLLAVFLASIVAWCGFVLVEETIRFQINERFGTKDQ